MGDAIAERKMRAARGRLAFLRPYFDSAIFSLILVESPGCQTVAVDKWKRLYYAPKFVHSLTVEQLVTCLLHELGHVLRDHHLRCKAMGVSNATAHVANIASDCEINDDLREEVRSRKDIPHLPDFAVYPETIGEDPNNVWEFYYQKILSNPNLLVRREGSPGPEGDDGSPGEGSKNGESESDTPGVLVARDCGSGAHGVHRKWEQGDPEVEGNGEGILDADWRDIQTITAEKIADHHKSRGTVPGGWMEWANTLLRPRRIPWDQELAAKVRGAVANTAGLVIHSYSRPSRRASTMPDIVMPSMRKPRPFVCIIGDTSGSMNADHDLALVRGVTEDICQSMGARIAFLATDAGVQGGVQNVTSGRKLELKGRGGTDMRVGIRYALKELRPRPDVLVVITDCGTPWPSSAPRCRVIVCAVGDCESAIESVPRWAKLIRVDPDHAQGEA